MTGKKIRLPRDQCIFDKEGYKMRAAAVCVRDESESEVLLVSSLTKPGSWIVPAGKVQAGEEAGACAMREAMEEAGALGRLGRFLGTYDEQFLRPSNSSTSSNNSGCSQSNTNDEDEVVKKRTSVFVLYVDTLAEEYEEMDSRRRQWFPFKDASKLLSSYKAHQAEYLKALQSDTRPRDHNLKQVSPSLVGDKKPPPPPLIKFIQGVNSSLPEVADRHVNDVT